MRAAYRALKDSAARRRISFKLPYPIFKHFAIQSDYLNRKGNGAHCLTVDRIDNSKGYCVGNIQALSRAENAIKGAKRDKIRMEKGYSWESKYK